MIVTIHLAALVRLYYSEDIEVPDDITNDQLDALVEDRKEAVDADEYEQDMDYWEEGCCWWEKQDGEQGGETI